MVDLLGLIFGGLSRLAQHWLDLRDKDKERAHEATMYDKQLALADKRFAHDAEMRQLDATAADTAAEWQALEAAVKAQAAEARAAGGWVAKFSAVMRPLLTFYHAILFYTAAKAAMLVIALDGGLPAAEALASIYTEFDRALCGSMVGFWFQDRALRKLR